MTTQTVHFYAPAERTGDALPPCLDCGASPTDAGFGPTHEPSRLTGQPCTINLTDDPGERPCEPGADCG